jgi:DHA3 family macrolide efflux protein-like MFS transporter
MQNRKTLRTFYILILTQTFSLIGSEMTGLAIAIKVFKDTAQATPLALTMFFAALPSLVSASIAGVLADRWDRRYVMMLADAGQAVGTLLLLISFATGAFQLWHLYVVSLIQAVFAIFQRPAFSASVTMLVPDSHRDRANAIQQLTSPAASIIAPIIAGLLFAVIGAVGVMAIDLFTFLVAVVVVAVIHIPRPVQSAEGRAAQRKSIWREALVGFRFMTERPAMLYMVMFVSFLNFLLTLSMGLNAAYILGLTDNNEAALGTISGVFGIGALAGGIIMSVWGGTRPRIHTIMPGIFGVGIGLALYGLSRSPLTLGVSIIIMALPLPMINASFSSILQLKVPPDLQGRVFASLGQISQLLMPLAYLLAGPLADKVFEPAVGGSHWGIVAPLVGSRTGSGIGLIMFIGGSLTVLVTVVAYSMPMLRHIETLLPDYEPVAAEDEAESQPVETPQPAMA